MVPEQNSIEPAILQQLSKLKPYVMALLKKGPNYNLPDSRTVIQAEHLPHTFKQRAAGIMAITMPMQEDNSDVAAIGIYTITDKAEIQKWLDADPAVVKGIFTYELLNCIGMQGDTLT